MESESKTTAPGVISNPDGTYSVIVQQDDLVSVPDYVIARTGPLDDFQWWWVRHDGGIRVTFRSSEMATRLASQHETFSQALNWARTKLD